ncbi:MAG: Uncharacterised protein [Methanobacteriota archaeon]|nr:MAG: Uncharacterised protein [Euryarchaeota archaeon]
MYVSSNCGVNVSKSSVLPIFSTVSSRINSSPGMTSICEPCSTLTFHLWSGLASTVIFAESETLGSLILVQLNPIWNNSRAGTSAGNVTYTAILRCEPGPRVRSGLPISNVTLGAYERFPANV